LVGEKFDKSLYKLIEKLFIQDCIEIPGGLDLSELITEYQNAAVFVIPSFQEGLCIPGLEAFACGVPVISTKCGGPEDYIKNDYNGYLVENNNVQALASAILNFLSFSHEKRKTLGENARNYVLGNYNEDKIWPQFLECFNF
jgi:glycosyltransferase involved in cell wall biosynthesis